MTRILDRTDIGPDASLLQLAASRSLVRAEAVEEGVEEVVGVLIDLVRDLGGSTIPSRLGDGQALPLDCSFGHGEPLLARPDSMPARPRNERILPEVLDDARAVISRLRQRDDLADLSNTDFLTGLLNRCAVDQLLSRLRFDDAVVVMNIDNFNTVNDRWGHAVSDELLIAFARTLAVTADPAIDSAGPSRRPTRPARPSRITTHPRGPARRTPPPSADNTRTPRHRTPTLARRSAARA